MTKGGSPSLVRRRSERQLTSKPSETSADRLSQPAEVFWSERQWTFFATCAERTAPFSTLKWFLTA